MTKNHSIVDPERGIVQITTTDERWYARPETDSTTGLPYVAWRPSVTWICDYYPKGKGFELWLKKNGDESDNIARLAADRGYKVHRAVALLNAGEPFHLNDPVETHDGTLEPLTPDEYFAVMTYVDWWNTEGRPKYQLLKWEYTVWPDPQACGEKFGVVPEWFLFAGTIDLKVRRLADNTVGIIDFKTSLDIWPAHRLQVSAYAKAEGADWAAILQLNYRRNKTQKWKFTEIPDCFGLFIATWQIWKAETVGVAPLQRDFPLELTLNQEPAK
jgi:hypothetical protein